MYMKLFVTLIILLAVAVGLGTQLPRDMLVKVIIFRDFFDTALPILGFGALVKYLCSCCGKCPSCETCKCQCKKEA